MDYTRRQGIGMDTYEKSELWKRTLAVQNGNDPQARARERLRTAFQQARDRVRPLVEKIGQELPMLTVHDITHLDALWLVADKLLGEDYPVNPAEAFVLGMAFLLHDAATSTFAYDGGIDGLRTTPQWKDFVAQQGFVEKDLAQGTAAYQRALFETLRLLHPLQAERMLSREWTGLDGKRFKLLNDVELVNAYGETVGRVASSHGKDIGVPERDWANAVPLAAPPSIVQHANGEQWTVDRLKLAMLLRCIDAAHIDSYRAPGFLAALNAPTGESKHHWVFQNKLSAIAMTANGEVYWSGETFAEHEAEAWWRCHDAHCMIDREIRASNKILRLNGRKELRARGVMGANDIETLKSNVPCMGWHPVDIRFQISGIGQIIEKFGGAKLYGDKPYLALRELMQNAIDAIHARRIHRGNPTHGTLKVSLEERDGQCWLHVLDDGVGMSRYVLTEVLLDFGRSLWTDAALREQWSGLASKGFSATGKFGIGFFSVFMLGDEVKVATWRDGDAEENQVTLYLKERSNARPLLLETPISERLQNPGTLVSVRLRNGRESLLFELNKKTTFGQDDPRYLTLAELVGILAPAADIDILTKDCENPQEKTIIANDWQTLSNEALMERIAPAQSNNAKQLIASIQGIRDSDGALVGRAAVRGLYSDYSDYSGALGASIGILAHNGLLAGYSQLPGILIAHNNADLARDSAMPICSADSLKQFVNEQAALRGDLVPLHFADNFLSLGYDQSRVVLARVDGEDLDVAKLRKYMAQRLSVAGEVIILADSIDCPEDVSSSSFDRYFELDPEIVDVSHGFEDRRKFGLGDWIDHLLPETSGHPRSTIAAIYSLIEDIAPDANQEWEERVVGDVNGQDIRDFCLIFSSDDAA